MAQFVNSLSSDRSYTYPSDCTLDRLNTASRVVACLAVGLFALSILFLGLAQGSYIHPLAPLFSLGAILPIFLIIKGIDCCRESRADTLGYNLRAYDLERAPLPSQSSEASSSENSSIESD